MRRIRVAALLPTMALAAVLAGAFTPSPVGSIHDEPSVQMTVTPAR